jgi:hypothetical protein
MPDPQTDETELLKRIAFALERIAYALEQSQDDGKGANYFVPIKEFKTFDWSKIGAVVLKSDQYGVAVVSVGDREYIRRSPENNFAIAIFFSRYLGTDDNGKKQYERLITFKQASEVNPVSRKAEVFI